MNKLIYIIGPAYSGSTLLGLLLGKHPEIINLGEVMNLEHDYKDKTICTCGSSLDTCVFWNGIKKRISSTSHLNFLFEESKGRDLIDERGGMHKLKVVAGMSLEKVFGQKQIDSYKEKNENFFHSVLELNTSAKYLVDLSKSPERLELLSKSKKLDIYCIYLKRNREEVFASTIKRPKRTRAKFRFKILREAIWLNLRTRHEKRVFNSLPADRRLELDWDNLSKAPNTEMPSVLNFLGLKDLVQDFKKVNTAEQHIYVGNRWLFKLEQPNVAINPKVENLKLTSSHKMVFNTVSALLGNKR